MIAFEPATISVGDQQQLLEWLAHPGRTVMENAFKAQIARLQAESTRILLEKPDRHLNSKELPEGLYRDLGEALKLQIFLDILRDAKPKTLTSGKVRIE